MTTPLDLSADLARGVSALASGTPLDRWTDDEIRAALLALSAEQLRRYEDALQEARAEAIFNDRD